MRRHTRLLGSSAVLALVACFTLHGAAVADSESQKQQGDAEASRTTSSRDAQEPRKVAEVADAGVRYEPPRRGAPRNKLGGGLRFAAVGSHSRVTLHAFAPDHVAHTRSPSPVLYWYVDPLPALHESIEFTLIDEASIDPVAEVQLVRPDRPGFQSVDLAALGVELAPEVEYEWSVALVVDRWDRSRDRVRTGYLRYVAENPQLAAPAGDATPAQLARAGLWYDALERISGEIEADPAAAQLRVQRAALLGQAGFTIPER
jgi:hypothetical protein